jgi:hypothetical protein
LLHNAAHCWLRRDGASRIDIFILNTRTAGLAMLSAMVPTSAEVSFIGDWIDGWRVCWIGGWDKYRVVFHAMAKQGM